MAHAIPKIVYGSFVPTVIAFDYPPTEPEPEQTVIDRKQTQSLSGIRATQLNSVSATRRLVFRFLSEAKKASLESFVQTFASYGKAFKYYDDANSVTFKTYELDQDKLSPKPIAPVGANVYIYEAELNLRRVVDDAVREGMLSIPITNNQAVAADVDGLSLDSSSYRSVQVFFELWRKTGSSERVSNGSFKCLYDSVLDQWSLVPPLFDGDATIGEPCGVTFTVTTGGQVQYTSDNMAGTGYDSEAIFRNFTVLEG